MHRYTIGKARDQFSRLVREVRSGETVVIYDRDEPVAILSPVPEGFVGTAGERLEAMAREGQVVLGTGVAPDWFLRLPPRKPVEGALEALLAERDESPW
jgi:antitoxin (DNA-binding transcriptional repressor) of toxin-antitoxin stability system